jgi:hypothetical protein
MTTRKKWLLGIGLIAGIGVVVSAFAASRMTHRLDPYIREQVLLYLQERFDGEVEIQSVAGNTSESIVSRMWLTHRPGAWATIDGSGVLLRYKGTARYPCDVYDEIFSFQCRPRRAFR